MTEAGATFIVALQKEAYRLEDHGVDLEQALRERGVMTAAVRCCRYSSLRE